MKSHMHTRTHSDWKGLWAVLWRSVVFVPYMLMVFICVGGLWLSRWVLPAYGASLVYLQEWRRAAMAFALWLLVFWCSGFIGAFVSTVFLRLHRPCYEAKQPLKMSEPV
jgi:hypothetical protein